MLDTNTIRTIANQRVSLHAQHSSCRPLSEDYEYVGLLGEVRFAETLNLSVDLSTRPKGDNGIDFYTPIGTIDVKTARKAYNLIVEKGKVFADIYVLAQYADDKVAFLGWEHGDEIKQCPTRDFGYGIINHYKPVSQLKHMMLLKGMLDKWLE